MSNYIYTVEFDVGGRSFASTEEITIEKMIEFLAADDAYENVRTTNGYNILLNYVYEDGDYDVNVYYRKTRFERF